MKPSHPINHAHHSVAPLRFIENKRVDWERLRELLTVSESMNHWANFGPVTKLLEAHLHHQLRLPTHARVVASTSCSTALEALSQTVHHFLGRKPRWVVSSFSFFSTLRGEFANAMVVDCNPYGFLSLEALAQIPPDRYDGFVFTNIFGLRNTIDPYWDFAKRKDKFLLIDNAAGLTAFPKRDVAFKMLEAISFHHTKPHGFGEGGCAILHEELEPILHSVLNYGAPFDPNKDHLGMNGKLSDPAAAFIMQRLESHPTWSPCYIEQANRIISIGKKAGLNVLYPNVDVHLTVPGHIPFLSVNPISREALRNKKIVFRKYYRPHDPSCANAADIFSRILNVPCHPGVATLSDEDLHAILLKPWS